MPRGHGGVAIMWKTLDNFITPLTIGNERIQCVKLSGKKNVNLPTYIGFVDGKSAFDVVVHANLIRRLFSIGILKQSILMVNSLYQNAASCIKWNNQSSNTMFKIEQGGAPSADLYKVYINPLLNI